MVENGSILSMDAMADFIRTQAKAHHLPKAEAAVILPGKHDFCPYDYGSGDDGAAAVV